MKSHDGKFLVSVSKSLDFETHTSLGLSLGLENMKSSVSVSKKSEKSLVKLSISRFQKFESRSQSRTWDQGRKSLGIGLESENPVSLISVFKL